jgi:nicotinamide-nucleotide amidase
MIPAGALAVENPVGTAPAFIVETPTSAVISLPGVPGEMSYLLETAVLPYLRRRLGLSAIIKSRVLKTAGTGESWLDERIADLERLSNPTVGLSAHPGQVDVRITAKAGTEAEADRMLGEIEAVLRQRLGAAIFGAESDSLEAVVAGLVSGRGWRLAVVEHGTGGALSGLLAGQGSVFAGGHLLPERVDTAGLPTVVTHARQEFGAAIGLGVVAWRDGDRERMAFHLAAPDGVEQAERSYGGPPDNAADWVVNMALDFLRRRLA